MKEVDDDMRQNQTKIDIYMRDLRKHALVEYNDLYIDEQNQLNAQGSLLADSKSKHKRKKRQKKKKAGAEVPGQDQEQAPEAQQQATLDGTKESMQNQFASQKSKKSPQENSRVRDDAGTQTTTSQQQPAASKNKKKRKKKKNAQDTLTNEQMNSLDIDELVEFINNKGSKKEDLQKAAMASSKKVTTNSKSSLTTQGQLQEGSTLETQPEEMEEEALEDATNRQQVSAETARHELQKEPAIEGGISL